MLTKYDVTHDHISTFSSYFLSVFLFWVMHCTPLTQKHVNSSPKLCWWICFRCIQSIKTLSDWLQFFKPCLCPRVRAPRVTPSRLFRRGRAPPKFFESGRPLRAPPAFLLWRWTSLKRVWRNRWGCTGTCMTIQWETTGTFRWSYSHGETWPPRWGGTRLFVGGSGRTRGTASSKPRKGFVQREVTQVETKRSRGSWRSWPGCPSSLNTERRTTSTRRCATVIINLHTNTIFVYYCCH